jgi:tetratricopeptide (TPR) repeat protein
VAKPVHVSVDNDDEASAFLAERGLQAKDVVLVDVACPAAYKLVAFHAFELKAPDRALVFLDKAIAIAPYFAEAYSERGFVLNQVHRAQEGADSYRKALAILELHPDTADKPVALRGLGYSLVELGDLAGARKAYEQSLELDPGNSTALSEIDYIDTELAKSPATP